MKHENLKFNFLKRIGILFLVMIILLFPIYMHRHLSYEPTSQKLLIRCEPSDKITRVNHETLNGMHGKDIQYRYISNVTIEIGNEQVALEDAIRDGMITVSEISSYARIDAQNGFCTETCESRHGVSHFTYQYPDFNLRTIYDIYETPDGQQHLINDIMLLHPDKTVGAYTDFYNNDGNRLDREDWGLDFEISAIMPKGITLNCIQSEGQQIGTLVLDGFTLRQDNHHISRLNGSAELSDLDITILSDSSTDITIDWTEDYGELPAGEYLIILHIRDIFDETQVHPLMEDFHDWQMYDLTFVIPEQ